MQHTFNPDHAVKPDDWQKELCKNCEHLQKQEDFYCKNQPFTLDPEHMSCELFKNRYR